MELEEALLLGVPLSLCVVEGEIELEGLTLGVSAALGVELSEIEGVAE